MANPMVTVFPKENPTFNLKKDWSKRGCKVIESMVPQLERIRNFSVREDDVWVVVFPKCGTTWMQELAWLLVNNFDYKKAKEIELTYRSPFLEFVGMHHTNIQHGLDTIELADSLPSPRVIKSHLPLPLLPREIGIKGAKIIYVVRDPRDAAISSYYHNKGMNKLNPKSKEEYVRMFYSDDKCFGPFWDHVLEFYDLKSDPNVFYTSYERMKADLSSVLKDIGKFLNVNISDQEMPKLIKHLSFDSMKDNPACNHSEEFKISRDLLGVEGDEAFRFVRKGISGGYKSEISETDLEIFNKWITDNLQSRNLTLDDILCLK